MLTILLLVVMVQLIQEEVLVRLLIMVLMQVVQEEKELLY